MWRKHPQRNKKKDYASINRGAWYFAIAMSVFISGAQAKPLKDELYVLLSTHPALKSSLAEADARNEEIRISASGQLPLIQATGESGFEHTDQPALSQFRNKVGLSVTQNLFDGDDTRYRVRASELNEQVGRVDFRTTQNDLLLQGIQTYLDVVLQNQLVGISSRHVEIVQEITNFITGERKLGRMTLADSLQSRARLQQAREVMVSFQGEQRRSATRYNTLFGNDPDIAHMDDPLAPMTTIPTTLRDGLEFARLHNPLLETSRLNIEMASAQRLASGSSLMPKIDLQGSADYKNNYDGVTGAEAEGSLLVKLSWDIFDGDRTNASIMAAAHRESAAFSNLHQKELLVMEQVRLAWHAMVTDQDRTKILEKAEAIALEAYNARYTLMKSGKDTIINVLDTALEVLSVRTALTTAEYRRRLSIYRLIHAMGQLNPENLNNIIMVKQLDMDSASAIAPSNLAPQPTVVPMEQASVSEPSPINDDVFDDMFALKPDGEVGELVLKLPVTPVQSLSMTASIQSIGKQFFVVLSSNRKQNNAKKDLGRIGFPASTVEEIQIKGKPMYMIVVGPLPEPEARLVQGEAFDAGILDAWLRKL